MPHHSLTPLKPAGTPLFPPFSGSPFLGPPFAASPFSNRINFNRAGSGQTVAIWTLTGLVLAAYGGGGGGGGGRERACHLRI